MNEFMRISTFTARFCRVTRSDITAWSTRPHSALDDKHLLDMPSRVVHNFGQPYACFILLLNPSCSARRHLPATFWSERYNRLQNVARNVLQRTTAAELARMNWRTIGRSLDGRTYSVMNPEMTKTVSATIVMMSIFISSTGCRSWLSYHQHRRNN